MSRRLSASIGSFRYSRFADYRRYQKMLEGYEAEQAALNNEVIGLEDWVATREEDILPNIVCRTGSPSTLILGADIIGVFQIVVDAQQFLSAGNHDVPERGTGEVHPRGQAAAGESEEASDGHRQAHHPYL